MGTVNTAGWQYMIDGNIEWAEGQPRTLERDHTIDLLKLLRRIKPSQFEKLYEVAKANEAAEAKLKADYEKSDQEPTQP